MNITKKAIKFTKLIAFQLKDLYNENYDKEELKSSFQEAVRDLSKREIKSEIQENIDKYVKKLQKYLNVQDGQPKKKTIFPCNLYVHGGHELTDTEGLSEQDRQLLVSHVVSEHVGDIPQLMSRIDDFPAESALFPELSGCHRLLRLTVGNRHEETLRQLLFKYFNAVQPLAEKMITDQEFNRCGELAKKIRDFICVCHLRKKDCFKTTQKKKKTPVYEDILASLLSIYVELFVLSERLESKKTKIGRQLCGFVVYVLPWQQHQLDLLLQLSAITEEDAEMVIPMSRFILKWNTENKDEKYYLKYVLAVRTLHDKVSDATDDIFQTTQTIPAPKDFMSWLGEQDSELGEEFPNDKGFKKSTITKFLLEEAADDQVDRLLDIFSCDQSKENQLLVDQSTSEDQQNKTVLEKLSFFIDLGESNKKEENEGIFFIDKVGLGSKENKNEDDDLKELHEETDTRELMETNNAAKLAEESDVMDTHVFMIDTESLVQQNDRKSPKKKRKSMQRDGVKNKTMDDDVSVDKSKEINSSEDENVTPKLKQSERLIQDNLGGSRNLKKKRKSDEAVVENLSDEGDDNVIEEGVKRRKSKTGSDRDTQSENVNTEIFVIDTEHFIQQDLDKSESSKRNRKSKVSSVNVDMCKSEEKKEHDKNVLNGDNSVGNEKDQFGTELVTKNLFKSVDKKCVENKDDMQRSPKRKNSHKSDEIDKNEVSPEKTKRTRNNSVKSDDIKCNDNKVKRTRKTSHKSDDSDKMVVGEERSIGKGQNVCTPDASDDKSAVKRKRTTSQISVNEENNDIDSPRRSRRVSECSLQRDNEENQNENEVNRNLCSRRSEHNDVSISIVSDQNEHWVKYMYKTDANKKDTAQTQKTSKTHTSQSEIFVESKTRKSKSEKSGKKLKKEKCALDVEMTPRVDETQTSYNIDVKSFYSVSNGSKETSGVETDSKTLHRSERSNNMKSRADIATSTNQIETSEQFNQQETETKKSHTKLDSMQMSRKTVRHCLELDFQREGNLMKPINMLNEKINRSRGKLIKDWRIGQREFEKECQDSDNVSQMKLDKGSLMIPDKESLTGSGQESLMGSDRESLPDLYEESLTDESITLETEESDEESSTYSSQESVSLETEVSDSHDESEDISLNSSIVKHLKIDRSVSKQKEMNDAEMRPMLPRLPSHPRKNDNTKANETYKYDQHPKLFENKPFLNSSDIDSDILQDTDQQSPIKQKTKRRQSEPASLKKTPLKEKPSVKTPGRKGMTLRSRKL